MSKTKPCLKDFCLRALFILFAGGTGVLTLASCSSDDGGEPPLPPVYGIQFNPSIQYVDFTDGRDNKTYKSVVIGAQTWMAENLNYDAPDNTADKCYNDNPANCATYGRLYSWATAMGIDANYNNSVWDESDVNYQGICPDGWHLPSNTEWTTLTDYVGRDAGTKLKATSGWNDYGNGADNYGFSALPGGGGEPGIDFGLLSSVGYGGIWWSATEGGNDNAYYWHMSYDGNDVGRGNFYKFNRYSVRCVKNNYFNPSINYGSFIDSRDNKTYKSVVIGAQTWMAENLNYDVPDNTADKCYNDNPANCATYGRLYNWETAMAGSASTDANPSGVRGVCPEGWHLPSGEEWDVLINHAGGNTAGTKLKAMNGWDWESFLNHSGNGTDDYGFSALPGGYVFSDDDFSGVGRDGCWWSTSTTINALDSTFPKCISMSNLFDGVAFGGGESISYSVRCVKNSP